MMSLWWPRLSLCLRVVGVLLALIALRDTYYAMWFRLDGSHELQMVEQYDLEVGGMFALAIVLFFAPVCRRSITAWLAILIGASVIWAYVSTSLIRAHQGQYRFRSNWPSREESSP